MQSSNTYSVQGVRAQSSRPTPTRQYRKSNKSKKVFFVKDPAKILAELLDLRGLTPAQKAARVTIWHRVEQRKIAGTAAPLRRNLAKYLHRNTQCDVYVGQDRFNTITPGEIDTKTGNVVSEVNRVTIWNPMKRTKITGNAAPLPKNLQSYFARHPGTEVYRGQDLILEHLHDKSTTNTQASSHVKKHVRKKENPPDIYNPHIIGAANQIEFEWERMKKDRLPLHMFHETHEPVPESYWAGNAAANVDTGKTTESTVLPGTTGSPSFAPDPFQGGNPIIGTDQQDFYNLDNISYADLASSWSNTPMWIDPSCQQKIETGGPFVTPIQADRSLVIDDSPLDLIREFQDFPITGSADHYGTYSSLGSSDINCTGSTNSGNVDLSLADSFFENSEMSAAKD